MIGYRIYRNSVQVGTTSSSSYVATKLTPGTTYRFAVSAYDASGNSSTTSNIVTTTTPEGPDTSAPSIPSGVSATVVSQTQINLAWGAAVDNVGVTGYRVYRNGTQIATTVTPSYSVMGLTAGTSYNFTVVAYDAAGNTSGVSVSAAATTKN